MTEFSPQQAIEDIIKTTIAELGNENPEPRVLFEKARKSLGEELGRKVMLNIA